MKLAFDALRVGGSAAALLNAANEIAVEAFLDRKIGFRKINELIATVMAKIPSTAVSDLESLLEQDQRARDLAHSLISS